MSEPDAGRVGSVAQESARLLDALFAAAPGSRASHTAPDQPGPHSHGSSDAYPEGPDVDAGHESACPTCGHVEGGAHAGLGGPEQVCHLCPVCQLLRVVRSVRPETLDRLAELAGAVTEALRDAAEARWQDAAGPRAGPRPSRTATVEDIPVFETDETDELEHLEDLEGAEPLATSDEEAP